MSETNLRSQAQKNADKKYEPNRPNRCNVLLRLNNQQLEWLEAKKENPGERNATAVKRLLGMPRDKPKKR